MIKLATFLTQKMLFFTLRSTVTRTIPTTIQINRPYINNSNINGNGNGIGNSVVAPPKRPTNTSLSSLGIGPGKYNYALLSKQWVAYNCSSNDPPLWRYFACSFESGDMGYCGKFFGLRESGLLAGSAREKRERIIPGKRRWAWEYL